jgi:lipid II:glycine glycyltransferase (peptidoglycan interpeptide bridge formation enzyme)
VSEGEEARRAGSGKVFAAHGSLRESVYPFDPLADVRWDAFVAKHPRSSVFHSSQWLEALRKTYGYSAIAYTTSAPGEELENAIVLCRVDSWLTGKRLVSLPFSDHCEPLVECREELQTLTAGLEEEMRASKSRYIELRPLTPIKIESRLQLTLTPYAFHRIDLSPGIETLFKNLHKDSIQRKIMRAQREGLSYEEGRSEPLLDEFYELLTLSRQRHRLPPQPKEWFRNLMECLGDSLKTRIARKDGRAVAAMMTVRYKDTLVYKYGGSDHRYHNLGGMHLLYWTSIQEAKASGLRFFDLGRTDADQAGLITFKKRWGASQSILTYSRFSVSRSPKHVFELSSKRNVKTMARELVAHLPSSVLSVLGRALYKHVG